MQITLMLITTRRSQQTRITDQIPTTYAALPACLPQASCALRQFVFTHFLQSIFYIDNKNLFKISVYTNIWIYTEPQKYSQFTNKWKSWSNGIDWSSLQNYITYAWTHARSAIIHRLRLLRYVCCAVRTLPAHNSTTVSDSLWFVCL